MSWLDRIAGARVRFRAGIAGDRLVFLADGQAAEELAVADAAAAVEALGERLGRAEAARQGGRLEVVVDGSLVRWTLAEMPKGARVADRDAIVRGRFGDRLRGLGDARIRTAGQPDGWPAPAAAIDGALVAALQRACLGDGIGLGAVRPAYASAFDHWRLRMPEPGYWFCVIDAGSIGVGLLDQRVWRGLHFRRADGDTVGLMSAMQAQIGTPRGIDAGALPAYVVDLRGEGSPPESLPPGWTNLQSPAPAAARLALGY